MISDQEIAEQWLSLCNETITNQKLDELRSLFQAAKITSGDPFVTLLIAQESRSNAHASEIKNAYANGKTGLTENIDEVRMEVITAIAHNANTAIETSISRESKVKLIKWSLLATSLFAILLAVTGYYSHQSGEKSGFHMGVNQAQQNNSWASTKEALTFYTHRHTINKLLTCDIGNFGWVIEDGICYPFNRPNKHGETAIKGWVVPN